MASTITTDTNNEGLSGYTVRRVDNHIVITLENGFELGYSPESGIGIIEVDGLPFKDFTRDGRLLPYADWRLTPEERAADLASRLSVEDIAGLMLYSPQNRIPMVNDTYGGRKYAESGAKPWDISDMQRKFITEDRVRHVLVSAVSSPADAARWSNRMQAMAEAIGYGIPANNSSDPRHWRSGDPEFAAGCGGNTSLWSNMLGLAATFDPDIVYEFGRIAAREYRLQGISTALSPQADLGTDPRWYRYASTFGNDPQLVADLTRAYSDGFQSPDGEGWSCRSVNTMAKHWPGGGSGEGGRDAHYGNGKYAVYPGGCFEQHKYPFTHGAFDLRHGTGSASAVMPYYTISYGQGGETVGNSYDRRIITDMLRGEAGYDGVVCTDWLITHDEKHPGIHSGKPWGVENLTEAERHYKALMAGVDQFGGNDRIAPVLEAYRLGVAEHGEDWMRRRMEQSARRLLLNMFRVGLFDNPYIDPDVTRAEVGNPEFTAAGYRQQLRSIIMLKNHDRCLPLRREAKIYVPDRVIPGGPNYWRTILSERRYDPASGDAASRYFKRVSDTVDADVAVVFIESPHSLWMGYDMADREAGGNGYIPISLQYEDYTATDARETSIAGGDPFEPSDNRSYRGKTARTINRSDLETLRCVRRHMPGKPLIAVVNVVNPMVMAEVEPLCDAILVTFDIDPRAVFDIIAGTERPSGLLPFEMPRDMAAVERHCEDRPHDIEPYTDADGNVYTFGFGLDFTGPISDSRTRRYVGK